MLYDFVARVLAAAHRRISSTAIPEPISILISSYIQVYKSLSLALCIHILK